METTDGTLLGGRVRYAQPREGWRSGIEPVFLAAAVPAQAGDLVLEAGCGAGAALLCLAARVPGVRGLGIDREPGLIALAQQNARANVFDSLDFVAGTVGDPLPVGPFDHAMANPPYHPSGTPSPRPGREAMVRAAPALLENWIGWMAGRLRRRGTLTLIVAAHAVPACLRAFEGAGCGDCAAQPLWPKPGQPAKLALLHAVRGSRAPFHLQPGLVLHAPAGDFTEAAERILRDGEPFDRNSAPSPARGSGPE